MAGAQGLTGALIGTAKDDQGGVLPGAVVRVSSTALIGGAARMTTNDKGQWHFPSLPPGSFVLDITIDRFAPYHEDGIGIGAGATIEQKRVLKLAGVAESIVVEERLAHRRKGPRIRASLPVKRSQGDPHTAGEHVRLHQSRPWRIPHVARKRHRHNRVLVRLGYQREHVSDRRHEFHLPLQRYGAIQPGIDFISRSVQSAGASAESSNVQGAVINVVTKREASGFCSALPYMGRRPA